MYEKIKVLHVMNGADLGGISSVVLNYYQHIERNKLRFDLAIYNTDIGHNGKKIEELGSDIFYLPLKSKSIFRYVIKMKKILTKGDYDVIHVHQNYTSYVPLIIATFFSIKCRIAHAHTTEQPIKFKGKIKRLLSNVMTPIVSTRMLACTNDAGRAVFGQNILNNKKYQVLNNAIDIRKFKFNQNTRNRVRENLGLEDKMILGNVGNLGIEKNHQFLLKIMTELIKSKMDWHLLIIGTGELLDDLKQKAKILGIEDSIYFLGQRSDVSDLLQAMDLFVMPSSFEGFAIAALEANTSGLPVYLSDKIPNDLACFSTTRYLSLSRGPEYWANEIVNNQRSNDRSIGYSEAKKYGYDIKDKAKELLSIYCDSYTKG